MVDEIYDRGYQAGRAELHDGDHIEQDRECREHERENDGARAAPAALLIREYDPVAVIGHAERPWLRSGARAGDRIVVTGHLGAAAEGLRLLAQGASLDEDGTLTATGMWTESSAESLTHCLRAQLDPAPPLAFARALKEDPDRESETWPDLVIIDGGKGQLSVAKGVFADLGIDDVALLGIAKGPDRNAGRETLHLPDRAPFSLSERDPVLYFLQRLRDEAHRFAIGTHRARRTKGIAASPLDEVPGIGGKRKKALLLHFGSAQAVAAAGLADLEAVDGISRAVARKIYGHFNADQ